jgi:hypothetical protein
MTIDEMRETLLRVRYLDYSLEIEDDHDGLPVMVGRYVERCVVTGEMQMQATRKWRLSRHMVPSEIVQTALKLVLTSAEHRVREHFTYRGERVYGPHFDVEALVQLAREGRLSLRNPPTPGPAA